LTKSSSFWCFNDVEECLSLVLNIVILIAKKLVIVVIFWNYESVEIWLNCVDFCILNDVIMIDFYLYDDRIVFDHDCNSCEIKCIDIELYLLNVER